MLHFDSQLHVTGRSRFVDDVPPPEGMLHGSAFASPSACGRVRALDLDEARRLPGVRAVFAADALPAGFRLGPVVADEPLFASERVYFCGQPLALAVADTPETARKAVGACRVEVEEETPTLCPREACRQGRLLQEPRVFEMGDIDQSWPRCSCVVEGSVDLGGQEHLYLETNRARAVPREDGSMTVYTSTQSPSAVQRHVAAALEIPMRKVEVDVKRLGGGFGGKEDQATHWACMAALAASRLQRPVQIVLPRPDDTRMTGKRHPYKQDFRIGLDKDGRILAYEVVHYQNSGAFMDLSAPVLERTVLHSTNAYAIPNVRIRAFACRTNLPPNTAFRGFGGPQGMFPLEVAIEKAAAAMGLEPRAIQERNLIEDGYVFHYGQKLGSSNMRRAWKEGKRHFRLDETKRRIDAFNAANPLVKKGYALMPVCFGISFTKTFLNQGSSLAHIYTDGSVSVSTGGIEMGQGVSSNMVAIVARAFGIDPARVQCNSTNTSRIANISPSAASATTDLNGNATLEACSRIKKGLLDVAATALGCPAKRLTLSGGRVCRDGEPTELSWEQLVAKAYLARVPLMAHGFYRSPDIRFDGVTGKGRPFHYHTYGVCLVEATVDCLRGRYRFDAARIVHDLGRSIVPIVDRGQIEGGLAQGLGWVSLEEVVFDKRGRLASSGLSTYKAPDGDFMPEEIDLRLLEEAARPGGPLGSKAVGEPPFMYGIAGFFALRRAIEAYRGPFGDEEVRSPLTPERVLLALYPEHGSRPASSAEAETHPQATARDPANPLTRVGFE